MLLHKLRQNAERYLESHATLLRGDGLDVVIDVRCGVDLIVMATHGDSGLRRWALGSVADTVLHTTTTPLVLVHVRS